MPLSETFARRRPFLGAILAGEFTSGSRAQLQSHRFHLVHCPYATVVQAFSEEGVDISSEESSSEEELDAKIRSFERLSLSQRTRIASAIRKLYESQFTTFFDELRRSIERRVSEIFLLTLSGTSRRFVTVHDAIRFMSSYDERTPQDTFVRYELNIRHTNGDEVRCNFRERARVVEFLTSLSASP